MKNEPKIKVTVLDLEELMKDLLAPQPLYVVVVNEAAKVAIDTYNRKGRLLAERMKRMLELAEAEAAELEKTMWHGIRQAYPQEGWDDKVVLKLNKDMETIGVFETEEKS